jgi:hypothetical protein
MILAVRKKFSSSCGDTLVGASSDKPCTQVNRTTQNNDIFTSRFPHRSIDEKHFA